jgi:NADPH:quinone reductase-like Zn-dependent oxidoreductase
MEGILQAVVFERAGQAEDVLQVRDVLPPAPAAGQVLIEVAARPIHPADFMFIAGRYRVAPVYPQTAGFDGVGRIVACAPDVNHPLPGTRVAFRHPDAWAKLAVAPVNHVYPVPDGIPDEVACQFPLNPLTAWGTLAECQPPPPGGRVLATAGRPVLV